MAQIILLDGGVGQELVTRAAGPPTPLWSTQALLDCPDSVRAVHDDFFASGATVATANTYALHRDRLAPVGLESRLAALTDAALDAAQAARAAQGAGRVAAAIGPLGQSYRPDRHPLFEVAVPLYSERLCAMAPRCDLVIFETVASLDMVRAVLAAAQGADLPVWIALTVDDADGTRLRSGEAVANAVPLLDGACDAALVNCSAPEAMPAALDALAPLDMPRGAYANAFERITKDFLRDQSTVAALSPRRDMGPDAYSDHAMRWLDHGATILGGCCEAGPAHIAAIAARLRAAGHEIV